MRKYYEPVLEVLTFGTEDCLVISLDKVISDPDPWGSDKVW